MVEEALQRRGLGGEAAPVPGERAGGVVLPVVSRRKLLWVMVGLRCRRLSDVAGR
jgi:hypothetical protein